MAFRKIQRAFTGMKSATSNPKKSQLVRGEAKLKARTREPLTPANQNPDHERVIWNTASYRWRRRRIGYHPENANTPGDLPSQVAEFSAGRFALPSDIHDVSERGGGEIHGGSKNTLKRKAVRFRLAEKPCDVVERTDRDLQLAPSAQRSTIATWNRKWR